MKESEIIIMSNYLIKIRKLETALKIINDKFSIQKNRELRNANKSKKFPAKKWKFVEEDAWRLPGEKATFPILLNQRQIKLNANAIAIDKIT